MNRIAPFLNITKRCDGTPGCLAKNVMYKEYDGKDYSVRDNITTMSRVELADGQVMTISQGGTAQNCEYNVGKNYLREACAAIDIDINGKNGPNQRGVDTFNFWLTRKGGVIPCGVPDETAYPLKSNCRVKIGGSCTAWVLIKNNMDYPPLGKGWD